VLNTNQPKKLGALNSLACSLEVALSSLFQKKLTKEFTRQIRLDVEQEVIGYEQPPVLRLFVSHFSYIWHTKSVRLSVIYGLTWSFIIMFGGLFSLALFQYIVYSSNADAVKIEALIDEQQKKVEDLKTQLEGVTTQVAKKLIPANAPIIPDLARRIKRAEKRVKDLEKEQTDQMPKRSPLSQSVLANVDTGFSKTLSQILWVAAAGTLGSIVSILIRVIGKSYDQEAYYDRLTPIFIGFFKPVIGASFGVLFLAFIKAEVISTPLIPDARKPVSSQSTVNASKPANSEPTVKTSDNSETKTGFFLFSVAFIVGFSERLAQDTISKLEGGSSASNKEGKG
jgi:cell division protein FtsL